MKKLHLITGYTCNNNCIFCYDGNKRHHKDKSTTEIIRDLNGARGRGCTYVDFLGGEPTIRKDIFKIISYAKKIGYSHITITTNGRLLCYTPFVEKLKKAGLSSVIFSIHGHNSNLHDSLTKVNGSFNQSIQGIENCKDLNIKIGTNTIITKQNYDMLPKIGELIVSLGIKNAEFIFPDPQGNALNNFYNVVPSIKEIAPYVKKLLDLGIKNKIEHWYVRYYPLCYIPEYHHLISEEREDFEVEHIGPGFYNLDVTKNRLDRIKIKKCSECKFKNDCLGIFKNYSKLKKGEKSKKITFLWISSGNERKNFSRNISISPIFLSMIQVAKEKEFEVIAEDTSTHFNAENHLSENNLNKFFERILNPLVNFSDIILVDGPPYEILLMIEFLKYLKKNHNTKKIIFTGYYVVNYGKRLVELLPPNIYLLKKYNESSFINLLTSICKGDFLSKLSDVIYKSEKRIYDSSCTTPNFIKSPYIFDFEDFLNIDLKNYGRISIFSSKGCKFDCKYCSDKNILGAGYFEYSPSWVQSQIKHIYDLYGVVDFDFRDSSLLHDKKRAKELMLSLNKINNKFNFSFNAKINQIDDSLIETMNKTNFNQILIGIETFNKHILDKYGKISEDYKTIKSKIDKLVNANILPTMSVIFGHPLESKKEMLYSLDNINKIIYNKLVRVDHYNLEARPGTYFFDKVKEGDLQLVYIKQFLDMEIKSDRFKQLKNYSNHFLTQKYKKDVGLTFPSYILKNSFLKDKELIELLDNIHYNIEKNKYEAQG